ncbi:MAG TPA: hypothetical protein VL091_14900 [Marinobacter sp.]|nr:hypothetical protein [Marinobacter sp.]
MSTNLRQKLITTTLFGLLSTAILSVTGCGGERSEAKLSLSVNTPANITNTSRANYDDNVNGLVTYKTLKGWLDNWDENKPAGIGGKLVIIQQQAGDTGFEFIKPNNENTFTYVDSSWLETRNNGVMNIGQIVLSGPSIDRFIRKYGIDVKNDLIVCAQGGKEGANGAYMNQGRCWFTFSYWGVSQENIAVLNGNNKYLFDQLGAEYFTSEKLAGNNPSPLVHKQVSSVKDLRVDNTALYASVEDVINALPLTDAPDNGDSVMLWDARNLPQYSAGQFRWNGNAIEATVADGKLGFQNNAPRQSHPRGALNLEFTNMLDGVTGLYYDKATIENIVRGGLTPKGEGFVSGGANKDYKLVQAGNAYQEGDTVIHYCETSMRAGVTILATAVILGIPSRLYDSAMIEWNSLTTGTKDRNGYEVLPENSPWNTEPLSAPVKIYGKDSGGANNVDPRSAAGWATAKDEDVEVILGSLEEAPLIVDAFAKHANLIPKEDRAYKALIQQGGNSGGSDSGGGSAALPSNPCGG